ncbi:MAG: undecaprenyl-diphosphate phosphatase [Candidatus Micrarchaeota archaeon]
MDIFQILVLGLIQGITEWLPVSSKTLDTVAYLAMGGAQEHVIYVLLYLHMGTIIAAAIYYRQELLSILQKSLQIRSINSLQNSHTGFYIAALAGTGIIGLPLLLLQKYVFENLNASLLLVLMGAGLLLTAYLLHSQKGKEHEKSLTHAGAKDGLITGLFQGLSVLAGVSRSGTTTTALAWLKYEPRAIFELSFILSIPTVICAELLFYAIDINFSQFNLVEGALLALSSFVFGYLTIGALVSFAKKFNLAAVAAAFGLIMAIAGLLQIS